MPTVVRFGGRAAAPASSPDAGELAPLLEALSWKYTKADAVFAPYALPAQGDREALAEDIASWAGRVWIHRHPLPPPAELRDFDILSLEPEFRDYIDAHGGTLFDSGLTLREIWASQQLYSAQPMVLFVARRYANQRLESVEPKRVCDPADLVWLIGAMCTELDSRGPTLNVLVSDGRSGHTIMVAGLNGFSFVHPRGDTVGSGWFSFHDPWPARSLLAPERDFDRVRALEDIGRPPSWLISPADLDRVVAGFLLPVDVLPSLADVFATLDLVNAMHRGTSLPTWIEDPRRPDEPFALTLARKGSSSPLAVAGLVGLGRASLIVGDLDRALERFEAAYRLDRLAARAASGLLATFRHPRLAREWAQRVER